MTSLIETAQAFLAIGGRVWIDPANRLGSMLDTMAVYSPSIAPEEAERREGVSRAFFVAKAADPAALATLVREYGQPEGPFVVWQES